MPASGKPEQVKFDANPASQHGCGPLSARLIPLMANPLPFPLCETVFHNLAQKLGRKGGQDQAAF